MRIFLLPLLLGLSLFSAAPALAGASAKAEELCAPEVLSLKNLIKEDLQAVRRARRALKQAQAAGDAEKTTQAEAKLREAKWGLKEHRDGLRRLLGPKTTAKRKEAVRANP